MNSEKNYIDNRKNLFFDTYAFFEILKGNPKYERYKKFEIITSKLNIFELYLGILREVSEEKANESLKKYYPFTTDFDENVIAEAAKLKKLLNKRDVSMTDCIGYALANQLDIKFLTGDNAFEGMENVEFVK